MQWTSEATRPSHHGSSIIGYAAQRSDATGLSGRTLRGHGQLEQPQHASPARTRGIPILARPRPGPEWAPLPTPLRGAGGRLRSQPRVRCPLALCSREPGPPGTLQQLAEFLSSFLQKLRRKLPTPLAHPRLELRQRPPARRPQLLPRRPAFVLLPHPALEPGRKLTHPSSGMGGCGCQAPLRAKPAVPSGVCTRLGARARGAPRSRRSPPQPRSPSSPPRPCLRSGPAAARSLPAAGGLPPSLGELGAGPRACAGGPHPVGRGAGNWSLSFAGAGSASCPPASPAWVESFLSPSRRLWVASWAPRRLPRGAQGPQRHLRAPRVKSAGRMPPESSVSRVRCCGQFYVGSTCFFFLNSSSSSSFFKLVSRWGGRFLNGQFPRTLQKSRSWLPTSPEFKRRLSESTGIYCVPAEYRSASWSGGKPTVPWMESTVFLIQLIVFGKALPLIS